MQIFVTRYAFLFTKWCALKTEPIFSDVYMCVYETKQNNQTSLLKFEWAVSTLWQYLHSLVAEIMWARLDSHPKLSTKVSSLKEKSKYFHVSKYRVWCILHRSVRFRSVHGTWEKQHLSSHPHYRLKQKKIKEAFGDSQNQPTAPKIWCQPGADEVCGCGMRISDIDTIVQNTCFVFTFIRIHNRIIKR